MPYQNRVNAADLGSWTHQQQNYFWYPPAQQANYPHLHLTGGTVGGVVTIGNLSYTTGGAGGNINLPFSADHGFPMLPDAVGYSLAYNIRIEDLNNHLLPA